MDEFGTADLFSGSQSELSGAVKAVGGAADFCLCNDLFGTYRFEAAQNGICYIHPTYGTVSRFGLIPLASSMDQIGIMCKNLADGFGILSLIAGNDSGDGAMFPEKSYDYKKTDRAVKVGVPAAVIERADESTKKAVRGFAELFDSVDIELPYFDVYKQVMYILSSAEISNNLSRYDGIKMGYRSSDHAGLDELYVNTRTQGFGFDAKLMSVMGAFVLSSGQYVPYYQKAMKIRRLIKEALNFKGYDVIALPTKISEDPYENLSLFALCQIAGLPGVSFSFDGCGVLLVANVKDESALLNAWEVVQR